MSRQGFEDNQALSVSIAQLGQLALLGLPCEVGPSISGVLRQTLVSCGFELPLVMSMCNGYAGYAHLPAVYESDTEVSTLSLYENAMSFAGWEFGQQIVELIRRQYPNVNC